MKILGKSILDGTADLASLANYAHQLESVSHVDSGSQEKLQSIINQILFS